ncbi:hypothetical protein [Martelella sp. AMO21009]
MEDQLKGTCRVLETVVAPHLSEPFARTILAGLVANLRMLTDAIPEVAKFLLEDNAASLRLLVSLKDTMTDEHRAALSALESAPIPAATDVKAQDERNCELRGLLAEAVCSDALTDAQRRAIIEHMSQRASRMPMRYVPTAPTPSTEENS